jgi:tetrahydromethanopterin S-methyltransferase subunit G
MMWEDEETGEVKMDIEEYNLIVKKIKDLEQRVNDLELELT